MTRQAKLILIAAVALTLVVHFAFAIRNTLRENEEVRQKAEAKKAAEKENSKHEGTPVELPAPVGPEGAPVKIQVFVSGSNSCHSNTITQLEQLAQTEPYQGKVRVEYLDTAKPEVKKLAGTAKIGCDAGLLLNGKSVMRIPGHGEAGLVMFTGPVGEKNYTMDDLKAGIDMLLKEKAKGKTK